MLVHRPGQVMVNPPAVLASIDGGPKRFVFLDISADHARDIAHYVGALVWTGIDNEWRQLFLMSVTVPPMDVVECELRTPPNDA